MITQQISCLRTRPKLITSQFNTVDVTTNYKAVEIKYFKIFLYSITFDGYVLSPENRLQYLKMLKKSRSQLEIILGTDFCFSGRTFYTFQKSPFLQKQLLLDCEDKQITAYVKFVKEISLADVIDNSKNKQSIMFLNTSLKNVLRKIGYNEIGRSRKYFDMKQSEDLGELILYRGYETSFSVKLNGILLKIEPVNRIVRKESVLSCITSLYQHYQDKSKQQKRIIITEQLVGKSVMANYGTSITWRIEGVVFDQNFTQLNFQGCTEKFDVVAYYKQRYNITIENIKQPLLRSTNRLKKSVLLVPQLCLMTGIPEHYDERKRRQVSLKTIKDANFKFNKMKDLDKLLQDSKQKGDGGWDFLNNLGVKVKKDFLKITAENMPCSQLLLGENCSVKKGSQSFFQLFNQPIFKSKIPLNILIIHFNYDIKNMENVFIETSKNLGLSIQLTRKNLGQFDKRDKSWFQGIEACIGHKRNAVNMILFVLPNQAKSKYNDIKKLCYSYQNNDTNYVSSQIVLSYRLAANNKVVQSIATKILLQMAVKVGNILWVPHPPKSTFKIMIIGMAITKIPGDKSNIVAYNSTKDKYFSRYFSFYRLQNTQTSSSIIEKAGEIVLQCINAYVDYNNDQYPELIIILRQGSTEAQLKFIQENQVKDVLNSISMHKKDIKLIYLSLDKKPTTKFYIQTQTKISNPIPGTLIRDNVISNQGDFYLIASQNNKTATVPTYFKILFNNTCKEDNMDTAFLAQLFYSQCHNYQNWTGSIKVPAQLQYACKLAKFKAEVFDKKEIDKRMKDLIYYI